MKRKSNISNNPFVANRNFFDKNFNHAKARMSPDDYGFFYGNLSHIEKEGGNKLLIYGKYKAESSLNGILSKLRYYYGDREGQFFYDKPASVTKRKALVIILCRDSVSQDKLYHILNNIVKNVANDTEQANKNFDHSKNNAKLEMTASEYSLVSDILLVSRLDGASLEIKYKYAAKSFFDTADILKKYYGESGRAYFKNNKFNVSSKSKKTITIECTSNINRERLYSTLNNVVITTDKEIQASASSNSKNSENPDGHPGGGGDNKKIKTSKMVLLAGAVLAAILILRS